MFLRWLFGSLMGLFYKLIPTLYDVFYDICSARFFTDDTIQRLANNIYILVSVVMLFTFGIQLIKAIVNPDLLFDSKKGTAAFFKRAIIAIVMIAAVPIIFNELYELQSTILENNLVEKLIVGFSGKSEDLKIGQYMSAVVLEEVLYPEENVKSTDASLETNYELMINTSVNDYYDRVMDDIGEKYNDEYVLHYDILMGFGMGIFVCYLLFTSCMDMAVRMVKLSLLQLIAPISIVAYIFKDKDNPLEKWIAEVGKTYAGVFTKLAALAFGVFALQQLPTFMDNATGFSHPWHSCCPMRGRQWL